MIESTIELLILFYKNEVEHKVPQPNHATFSMAQEV